MRPMGMENKCPKMQVPLLKSFHSEIGFDAPLPVMSQDWTGHESWIWIICPD